MIGWIILAVYAIVAFTFLGLILREDKRQNARFNIFQLVVALIWPLWGMWYIFILLTEEK